MLMGFMQAFIGSRLCVSSTDLCHAYTSFICIFNAFPPILILCPKRQCYKKILHSTSVQ